MVLITHALKFIKHGDIKCKIQDSKIIAIEFFVGEKKNTITLEDIKSK